MIKRILPGEKQDWLFISPFFSSLTPPLFSQKILHSLSHLKDHGWLPLILMLNPHQHFKTL